LVQVRVQLRAVATMNKLVNSAKGGLFLNHLISNQLQLKAFGCVVEQSNVDVS
jgi:hypothetical protein